MDKNSEVFSALAETIKNRKNNYEESSYTCYLFKQGLNKILKKVGEESAETIIAAKDGDKTAVTGEVSDLIFHLMVMLEELDIPFGEIINELGERAKKLSNLKVMKDTDKNT